MRALGRAGPHIVVRATGGLALHDALRHFASFDDGRMRMDVPHRPVEPVPIAAHGIEILHNEAITFHALGRVDNLERRMYFFAVASVTRRDLFVVLECG